MSKAEVYRLLAKMYKYTPQQIAEMTDFQQEVLLTKGEPGSTTLTFDTLEEFHEWQTRQTSS